MDILAAMESQFGAIIVERVHLPNGEIVQYEKRTSLPFVPWVGLRIMDFVDHLVELVEWDLSGNEPRFVLYSEGKQIDRGALGPSEQIEKSYAQNGWRKTTYRQPDVGEDVSKWPHLLLDENQSEKSN